MRGDEPAQQDTHGTAAKPREELHNLAKNIADCKELHLARRGITHLTDDVEAFESLEVLWLNDNSLSRIANLDFNPTIKCLYAHNNSIGTLKGSLLAFTFLHTLTLGNNRLTDLQGGLETLRLMRHLRYLELAGNPLAEEKGYRLLVIKNLPWLETLDMHKITDDERSVARRARVPKSWAASVQARHEDIVGLTQDLAAKEQLTKTGAVQTRRRSSILVTIPVSRPSARRAEAMLRKELSRMRCLVKQRRILLKDWFRSQDPRREEAVTQAQFTRCLRVHGLWPGTSNELKNGLVEGGDESKRSSTSLAVTGEEGLLRGILLEAFIAKAPSRAPFLGRDPPYLGQRFVNYVTFCAAVEPKHGGRDLDNQERELDKAWREERPPGGIWGSDTAGSSGAMIGGRGGNAPETGRLDDDDHDIGFETNEDKHDGRCPARPPMACEFTNKPPAPLEVRQTLLDHWERLELKRAMEAEGGAVHGPADKAGQQTAAKKAASTLRITREQALSSLRKMEELQGRRAHVFGLEAPLSVDDDSIFNQLSTVASAKGGVTATSARCPNDNSSKDHNSSNHGTRTAGSGGGRTNFDVMFDAAIARTPSATTPHATPIVGTVTRQPKAEDTREQAAGIECLLGVLEEGVAGSEGIGPLGWGWLSREEAQKRSLRLYREAAHAQQRMSPLPDEDENARREAESIRSQIAVLSRRAARLEAVASSQDQNQQEEHLHDNNRNQPRTRRRRKGQEGRVDVFHAVEFHGGPFRRHQQHDEDYDSSSNSSVTLGSQVGNVQQQAPASVSNGGSCIEGGSSSCAGTSQVSLATTAGAKEVFGKGARWGNGTVRSKQRYGDERPWFTKRELTVG